MLLAVMAALLGGCLDLDAFLFGGEQLAAYRFDHYAGERECESYIEIAGPLSPERVRVYDIAVGNETIYAALLHDDSVCTPQDTLILYFHGKGPHIDYYWPRTRLLYDCGFDSLAQRHRYPVLVVDYQGYGMSSGSPTEDNLYRDGRAALHFVQHRLGNPRVVAYGYSLGSLVACAIAAENAAGNIIALIMEAPIGSISQIVTDAAFLNVPASAVSTYTGDNTERIRLVRLPFLWLHGTNDQTLAIERSGRPIWNNYAGPDGACRIVAGGGHQTLPQTLSADYTTYKETVRLFVQGVHRENPLRYDGFVP